MEPTQKFSLYEYLTRKDSVFDKYANVKRFVKLDGWSWLTLIENNAYGLVYRSVVAHTGGGEGKSWVEWRTNLERVGKYELFVHIPRFSAMNIMYKSNLLSQWGTQAYTIVLPEARHEISIDTSDCGWISLGEYESTSGECVVMLHDTGDSNHIIIGDAVKWVYVGEWWWIKMYNLKLLVLILCVERRFVN